MTSLPARVDGAAPPPRSFRLFLSDYDLPVDIGFHEFEIGVPQRLLISVEVALAEPFFAATDEAALAWNYDEMRTAVREIATARRWNLQESLVRAIYDFVASRAGVTGLRVSARKPDIYPDCAAVGVELSSFT